MKVHMQDSGSFRDPSGYVYHYNNRVYRTVTSHGIKAFEQVHKQGILNTLVNKGLLLPYRLLSPDEYSSFDTGQFIERVLEHPLVPFISYPYEWCFGALRDAALHHLSLHLEALELGATLRDASAYNIQFQGSRPVFIDLLSLRPYNEGELWQGHKQFCEQFLVPLALMSARGIQTNAWYRGAQEGIPMHMTAQLLPLWWRLRPTILAHWIFPSISQHRVQTKKIIPKRLSLLSKRGMINILSQLQYFISDLKPRISDTTWGNYHDSHTYNNVEYDSKIAFVAQFIKKTRPKQLWDLGANNCDFSVLALKHGVQCVIAFDSDPIALEKAYQRAKKESLNLLPLYMDAANPTPDQGWMESERKGLASRNGADAVLALAFIHHLVIGRNIPLDSAIAWIMSLASRGVIEFIPATDPTIKIMMAHRETAILEAYDFDTFTAAINRHGRIVTTEEVSQTGRKLVAFER